MTSTQKIKISKSPDTMLNTNDKKQCEVQGNLGKPKPHKLLTKFLFSVFIAMLTFIETLVTP